MLEVLFFLLLFLLLAVVVVCSLSLHLLPLLANVLIIVVAFTSRGHLLDFLVLLHLFNHLICAATRGFAARLDGGV